MEDSRTIIDFNSFLGVLRMLCEPYNERIQVYPQYAMHPYQYSADVQPFPGPNETFDAWADKMTSEIESYNSGIRGKLAFSPNRDGTAHVTYDILIEPANDASGELGRLSSLAVPRPDAATGVA